MITAKNKAYKKFVLSGDESGWNTFKSVRNSTVRVIKEAKSKI